MAGRGSSKKFLAGPGLGVASEQLEISKCCEGLIKIHLPPETASTWSRTHDASQASFVFGRESQRGHSANIDQQGRRSRGSGNGNQSCGHGKVDESHVNPGMDSKDPIRGCLLPCNFGLRSLQGIREHRTKSGRLATVRKPYLRY